MFKSSDYDASVDRSKGVAAQMDGAWFQVIGDVPYTLKAALNAQSNTRFAIVPYQVYSAPFRELYLFHAALAARTFTVLVGMSSDQPQPINPSLSRTGDFIEVARGATVYKSANGTTAAGLWTPAAGKKFRLMGYTLELSGSCYVAAGAGEFQLSISDGSGGTVIGRHRLWLPGAAPAAALPIAYTVTRDLGNGFLSALAGRAVDFSLGGVTLAGGNWQANVWGTEE